MDLGIKFSGLETPLFLSSISRRKANAPKRFSCEDGLQKKKSASWPRFNLKWSSAALV